MDRQFQDRFRRYLSKNRNEISRDSYLLNLISPLYGLADPRTYRQWKLSNDLRYYEASHLINQMLCRDPLPKQLHQLAESLLNSGYDALFDPQFSACSVEDQILLIYRILSQDPSAGPKAV